jgi:exo-1,4-beta-D-glucosaminidase
MLKIVRALLIPVAISGSANAANVVSDLLVASAGDVAAIPGWYLQSALKVPEDLSALSSPGADSSSWYRVSARGTVMAGLLENGVYNETEMFYSDNMESMSDTSFESPWIYREVFKMSP